MNRLLCIFAGPFVVLWVGTPLGVLELLGEWGLISLRFGLATSVTYHSSAVKYPGVLGEG